MAYASTTTLTFVPEIWAAEFLEALRANLVFGGTGVINRNYQGQIANKGDTVHVATVGDPTIRDYTEHTDITVDKLSDSSKDLTITEAKYFAFEMDDIEEVQVNNGPGTMSEAVQNAAFGLSSTADSFISAAMAAGVDSGNQVGGTAPDFSGTFDDGLAYEGVVLPLKLKLDKAKVPRQGRWLVASPELEGALLHDDRFVRADASGSTEGLREGFIGRVAGFDVYQTTEVPTTAPASGVKGTQTILAGYPGAYTFADQIAKVERARMEKRFADLTKGLHLYGGKLLRPTGLASVVIDNAAALA